MTTIEYESAAVNVTSGAEKVLTISRTDIIDCVWSGNQESYAAKFKWSFDWNKTEIECLTGYIIVKSVNNYFARYKVTVDTNVSSTIVSQVNPSYPRTTDTCMFEYHLTPTYAKIENISYDEIFAPSEINDVVLVVEGKKIHVNKAFLSIHSEFFRRLFSANFKEGQMNEIPIEEVSYEDFGLLMSTFYPKPVFPNDQTVEKLLELADRFSVSSVIGIVEYHLIFNSRIAEEKILWLADKYVMEKRLERSIRQINTLEKAKNLKNSTHFVELSDNTRSRILARLMDLI